MTAQCFRAHPRLKRGKYMHLCNVSVLHVSEGQSYACIVPQNIVKTFDSLDDATRNSVVPHVAPTTVMQPAALCMGLLQAGCTLPSQGAGISARPMNTSQAGPGVHGGPANRQETSQVNTRCVLPPPTSTTLQQRIDQMRLASQNPQVVDQSGPKGHITGQNVALRHVLQHAATQSDGQNAGQQTPIHSMQGGANSCSAIFSVNTTLQQCSIPTEYVVHCTRVQLATVLLGLGFVIVEYITRHVLLTFAFDADSAVSAPRPTSSLFSAGSAPPTTRPRKAWVQRLKSELNAPANSGQLLRNPPSGHIKLLDQKLYLTVLFIVVTVRCCGGVTNTLQRCRFSCAAQR
jgi:hypothetical protein